ncbi:MAG: sugar phosphate isomerase/epimerase [Victivallales bacterium]|nr:sugar phosphate isomerase/epimerase [Victivallales bacterium]
MATTYGMSASLFGEIPFPDLVLKLSAEGWRQVELGFLSTPDADWRTDVSRARQLLADAGIAVPSVHVASAGWNVADPEEDIRQLALAQAMDCLAPAAAIGARVVICHHNAPRVPFQAGDRAASMSRSRESLKALADHAATLGLQLAVENLPQRHTPRPGGPIEDVLEIIDGLGDHMGVCVDAGHSNANGRGADDEVRIAGDKLLAVHIQDNDGLGQDQHWLPGTGTTDWQRLIAALDECAPTCIRTFEVGANGGNPDDVLVQLTSLRDDWLA